MAAADQSPYRCFPSSPEAPSVPTSSPSLLFAEVVSTKDEDKLGRVQVKLLAYGAEVTLPWLRTVQGLASKQFGAYVLPEIGDEVVVFCGAGNEPDGMVILGSVYNGTNLPLNPDTDDKNNLKQLVSRSGHTVTLNDTDGEEAIDIIASGEKISIKMVVADGLLAIEADKDINVTTEGNVTVDAKGEVTIKSAEKLVVDVKEVSITASGDVTVSGNNITVDGSAVEVNSSGTCKVTATGEVAVSGKPVKLG
jgi:type VI secretion system secreted protein VgrG